MSPKGATATANGRAFKARELSLIREVVSCCGGLSRNELAKTVCELVGWHRSNGKLKSREALDLLDDLQGRGLIELPEKQKTGRPKGSRTRVPETDRGEAREELVGAVRQFAPVELELAVSRADLELYRELVGRYHYLGYRVPYGASLRYLVWVARPERQVVGCLQFSSPAWRMAARDRWVGWSDEVRKANLQRLVSNSRFLLLPWVRVRNLASRVLSLSARQLARDWTERYGIEPLLLETLVDMSRFDGASYRAANWLELGVTTGRGRMDRERRNAGQAKTLFVYPLVKDARRHLSGGTAAESSP